VLFDFFVIISLCYNFAKAYSPDRVLSLWFLVYRIHVVLLFCEIASLVATGASHRAHLWFYEPSYLAIFMTGYFGSALYMFLNKGKRYSLDFALSLIGMLATTSATGIFGMIFAVLVNFALAKQRVTLLLASVAIAAFILGVLYLFFRHTPYYDLIAGFFFNQDFSFRIIVDRGGNRWIRTIAGWDAFQHHPWLGVGIGGDSAYMQVQPFSDYAWQFMNTWSGVDQIGMPFCNIVVEVLGTMGIAGFIPFAGILIYAILQVVRLLRGIPHPFTPAAMAFFMGFFTIFLALQFDGTFLRYYLWSPLGLALGAFAQIRNAQNGAAPPSPP
jgi:O-antigen ligase